MNFEYKLATPNQIPALYDLWLRVFDEDPKSLDLFFKTVFEPQNTLVCMDGNDLAAALYMLPANMHFCSSVYKAHYIFAAATEPRYRKKGIMGQLLHLAEKIGKEREEDYSFLLPANDSLYQYYAHHGYEEFFNIREITLPSGENSVKYIDNLSETSTEPDSFSLIWPESHKQYAFSVQQIYGGDFIRTGEGYAFYSQKDGQCLVSEIWAATPQKVIAVLKKLQEKLPQDVELTFRTVSQYFSSHGKIVRHGMIKCLKQPDVPKTQTAFLSFSLE